MYLKLCFQGLSKFKTSKFKIFYIAKRKKEKELCVDFNNEVCLKVLVDLVPIYFKIVYICENG